MAYYDDKCDECGAKAYRVSPMYCLCRKCDDEQMDEEAEFDSTTSGDNY